MKAKDYLTTWLWTSLLMYFLYDVVWVLADHEEFNRLLEERDAQFYGLIYVIVSCSLSIIWDLELFF